MNPRSSTLKRNFILLLALAFCLGVDDVRARPGDTSQPILVSQFPFGQASSTTGRDSRIKVYSCDTNLDESGPEVVYQLEVPYAGVLLASVEGDRNGVDIDIHLLSSLEVDGSGQAIGCLARGNQSTEAPVSAGTYYAVVDSFEGEAQAGAFSVHIDLRPDNEWYERQVAKGVSVKTRVFDDLAGGKQTVCVLELDPSEPSVRVKPICDQTQKTTSTHARNAQAAAAINGGFFDAPTNTPSSLIKIDGQKLGSNISCSRTSFGIGNDGSLMLKPIAVGADWPEAEQALGGVPRLVTDGVLDLNGNECAGGSFISSRHPRTALGITAEGGILMVTVDGRTSAGLGMTLTQLAQLMIDLGSKDAMNFDGGGSTTLYINGPFYSGVINYPSGGGGTSHSGERAVYSPLGVWADPLELDPAWISLPPTEEIRQGEPWIYEAIASHPMGELLTITVSGQTTGTVTLQDRGDSTARLEYTPLSPDGEAKPIELILKAGTSSGRIASQLIQLCLAGTDCVNDGGTEYGQDAGQEIIDAGIEAGQPDEDLPQDSSAEEPIGGCGCELSFGRGSFDVFLWIGCLCLCSRKVRQSRRA